jgi:protocatechuate 3,4-dioxygenase, beta subunit
MSRLALLTTILAAAFAMPAAAQDTQFIRALQAAQKHRPAQVGTTARIAPESEPGVPMVIHGRAFQADGTTPLADAIVFAYHTDRTGLYDERSAGPHSWRLKGWAKTDGEGRFEFRTIRPGAYPENNQAAHVHFTLFTPDGARYHAGELQFEDDTLLPERARAQSRAAGNFGSVQPVRREGTTQHVDVALRVNPGQKF